MVLADDNFATIVSAIEEGRRIYDNIKKAIQFLLGSNMSEVLSIFFANIFGFTILEPTHLLWINLVSDCFPAVGLGMEAAEDGIMKRKPRKSGTHIFSDGMGINLLWQGFVIAALTFISYMIGRRTSTETGTTMAFLTLSVCEMLHAWNMRSLKGSVFSLKHSNSFLLFSVLASMMLTLPIIFVPVLRNVFSLVQLSGTQLLYAILLAAAIVPIVEIVKAVQRSKDRAVQ
jgi:Ca2+-transporting ATPase